MAKRYFKLPGKLTKEQDAVIALPFEGQHLVVGGPGTGKSVVALIRARIHKDEGKQLLLTYNHVLSEYCSQLVEKSLDCETAISWFCNKYYRLTEKFVPKRQPTIEEEEQKRDMSYAYDYNSIIDRYEKRDVRNPREFPSNLNMIIDEGQDLPQGYYLTLDAMGCKNFFITADQNQQIRDNENSTIEEIAGLLGLNIPEIGEPSGPGDVNYLSENLRNTAPIARFANHFYTDNSSPPPRIPENPSVKIPVLYEYNLVVDCVKMILREADSDPSLLIGVIVATDTKREDYVQKLQKIEIPRDNETPRVKSYSASQKSNVEIDYSEGGIVVLCDKSVKGVEFDSVYIVLDGLNINNNNITLMKKRLFVMASRAMSRLVLFKGVSCNKDVTDLLPTDENILERDTL
jgi:DNA helicase IV